MPPAHRAGPKYLSASTMVLSSIFGLVVLAAAILWSASVLVTPSTLPSASTSNFTPSLLLSTSPTHIHFRVQDGLRVIAQAELDALHARQRLECEWTHSEDEGAYEKHREQQERWSDCRETNASEWTCSACSYPLLDYHSSWGHGVDGSSARIPDRLYESHFTGAVPLHGFVHAVHEAYRRHLPLTIAVEDVWIVIIQGLAQHINQHGNAERLRHHFVAHSGKETISMFAWSWHDMFRGFADEIAERTVPGRAQLFARRFSTTSDMQSLIMHAALMDAMQAYYEYEATLICGIPSVRLLGTEADWLDLQTRLVNLRLAELDPALAVWAQQLSRVVGAMVDSRLGAVDVGFWRSLYRMRINAFGMYMGCAGPADRLDGHVLSFFPYVTPDLYRHKYTDLERNPALFCGPSDGTDCDGGGELSLSQLPSGVSRVPFVWMNAPWVAANESAKMKLYAGFDDASVVYADGLEGGGEVRAMYGWALSRE